MGWNNFSPIKENPLLFELENGARFYFLHSYYFECTDAENVIATTEYGIQFASAICKENIFGIQCHPEKSHHFGIKLLHNFSKL